jgi:hypothetical protein
MRQMAPNGPQVDCLLSIYGLEPESRVTVPFHHRSRHHSAMLTDRRCHTAHLHDLFQ